MRENDKTIQAYEDNIQEYIDKTPKQVSGDVEVWIDTSLEAIPKNGTILELGSAFGRDADYMENKGFRVQRSDATEGFVKLLRESGHSAEKINAITDDLGGPYDMVFANAVLLHFTREEAEAVLDKVRAALKPEGIFSLRIKKGNGAVWDDDKMGTPRFFQYYQTDEISDLLTKHGFKILSIEDGLSKYNTFTWLQIITTPDH